MGNIETMRMLIGPPYNLQPNIGTLRLAILTNNAEIVRILLAPPYSMSTNQGNLRIAINGGIPLMIELVSNAIP